MTTVSETLRAARDEAGMRQADLARALGVSPQFVSDVEHGRRNLPLRHYSRLPLTILKAVVQTRRAELSAEMSELAAILSRALGS